MTCPGASFNPYELLKQYQDYGMPLMPLVKGFNLYDVAYDLFDPIASVDPTDNTISGDLSLKGFPVKLTPTMVNDCCQVEWNEQFIDEFPATTASVDFTGTTVASTNLVDAGKWRGISIGSQLIHISMETGQSTVTTVTAISGSGASLSLTLDKSITVKVGDVLSRGPKYAEIGNCTTSPEDYWTGHDVKPVVSNFARIPVTMKFNKCQLNVNREMYDAGFGPEDWVKNEVVTPMRGFRYVFGQALLFGTNTAASASGPSQTMSFITGIKQAQACVNPTNDPSKPIFVHNFKDCCVNANNDCEILQDFETKVIETLLASGAYNNGEQMTVWSNQEQIKEFRRLGDAIMTQFGPQAVVTRTITGDDNGIIFNKFQMHSFEIGGVRFEYKYSEILTRLFPKVPVMIIFPRSFVKFYQYAYEGVDENFRLMVNKEQSARIQIVDASPLMHMQSGNKDCYLYKGSLTYALALYNLTSGAYALVYNLRSKAGCSTFSCATTFDPVIHDAAVAC